MITTVGHGAAARRGKSTGKVASPAASTVRSRSLPAASSPARVVPVRRTAARASGSPPGAQLVSRVHHAISFVSPRSGESLPHYPMRTFLTWIFRGTVAPTPRFVHPFVFAAAVGLLLGSAATGQSIPVQTVAITQGEYHYFLDDFLIENRFDQRFHVTVRRYVHDATTRGQFRRRRRVSHPGIVARASNRFRAHGHQGILVRRLRSVQRRQRPSENSMEGCRHCEPGRREIRLEFEFRQGDLFGLVAE